MSPEDVGFFKGIIVFVLLAGSGMTFYWMRMRAKALTPPADPRLGELEDEQARLRAEMDARLAEMENRQEFIERRLTRQDRPALPAELPAVSTPV